MRNSTQNQFIADVARDPIGQLASQEILLFRANSEAYFKDPDKALKRQMAIDEMLGFGTAKAVSFLTPVALAVSAEVVEFVTEEIKKSFRTESSDVISDLVKSMFKKYRSTAEKIEKPISNPLMLEQLQAVHKIVIAKAHQHKLSESKAKQLADALIGDLMAP